MAFGFGNAGGAAMGGSGGAIPPQNGPDLEDIQTEALGFLSLAGEAKVQLLPTPWPSDNLPAPTSSLLSIASHKGLVAAAGPDAVIVTTTESVRKAFEGPATGNGNLRAFQPQLKLPMSVRISQLAFSADESYLVLSAESGGGLAIYDVQALLQGSTQSAFELSTNSESLRALIPNPTPEKGELFAIVTTSGKLMMANLKERNYVTGRNGPVLKEGVSCISWSARGKQLVAGLGDGTAHQMTPEGDGKAEIPKPPNVAVGQHVVSSLTWLENNVFLLVHTPSTSADGNPPFSTFHIATRNQQAEPCNWIFQKISDPAGPFGLNRSPPHHFFLRLRDYPPNLQDLLIVTSSASIDVGVLSRSKVPLSSDKPADQITNVFTMTEMSDDSRRAQLPLTASQGDTSPIGTALDLSSKEKVVRPIPGDEMNESPHPLPALMILNNEGVLAGWWVIYTESVRGGSIYPGLVVAEGNQQQTMQPSTAPAQSQTSAFGAASKPAFGASAFGASSNPTPSFASFAKPTGPAAGSSFGAPSFPGPKQSVWGGSSNTNTAAASGVAFGAPSFGSNVAPSAPATNQPSFGTPSTFGGLGNRVSPWGANPTSSNPTFGSASKPAGIFGASTTPAAANSTSAPAASGFASFANKGGFAATSSSNNGGSIFAKPASGAFGGSTPAAGAGSIFGSPATNTSASKPAGGMFGTSNFTLGSTFKADPSSANDTSQPQEKSGGSFFGGNFGSALGEAAVAPSAESKDADMDTMDSTEESKPEDHKAESTSTPAQTAAPTPAKSNLFSPPTGGLFGNLGSSSTTTSKPSFSGFSLGQPTAGSNSGTSVASKATPFAQSQATPTISKTSPSPQIKKEEEASALRDIPEAPLPPDTTSKSSFQAGESSVSSTATDAPLPPDFLKSTPKAVDNEPKDLPLPPDFVRKTSTPVKAEPADAPLPPDFLPQKTSQVKDISQSPPAKEAAKVSIPSDLIPPTSVPDSPDDDDEGSGSDFGSEDGKDEPEKPAEETEEFEDEQSEEGSGEDVAKDLSPVSEFNQTPGFTPESSFSGFKNQSPQSMFTKIQKPNQPLQPRPLFGEFNHSAPSLPPPKMQASPRSPSPIRNAIPGRMLRSESSRSVSAPGMASNLLGSQRLSNRSVAVSKPSASLLLEQQQQEERRRAEIKARKEAEQTKSLIDEEDENLQRFLASEIDGTLTLDEFVAHINYDLTETKDSIPAQVEAVYRDINAMIDTLGINARALASFIKGHTEQYKEEGRSREDLEDEEDWCLVEMENLSVLVEKDLGRQLEEGRVKDVAEKLEACNELQKDLARLRAKHEDIKKILASHSDPDHHAIARVQPLSAEQAAQQHDLRRDFKDFQALLSQAEEGLTILRAKLSSISNTSKANGAGGPTVEAVMRTIMKMTSMAEKRSGDIDVLEGQLRKLRIGTPTQSSLDESLFTTPQKRASLRHPGTSSTYGLFYTPDSIKDGPRGLQNSIMSTGSPAHPSPLRKKLSGFTPEEKVRLRGKLERKKEVTGRLKEALRKAGTNIRLMDDDDN
ncbi:hypothetical protein F5884DRAFT_722660 [Xylogone sp. PMI_703]|nr:hypothetical protein F5884DRAFT_722660 [Xylogone sp. PMI_703]